MAREILWALDPGGFLPVEGKGRIGIKRHDGGQLCALRSGKEGCAELGDTHFDGANADVLRGHARAFSRLDLKVEPSLFIPALFERIVYRRMVGAGRPVQNEAGALLCACPGGCEREHQAICCVSDRLGH